MAMPWALHNRMKRAVFVGPHRHDGAAQMARVAGHQSHGPPRCAPAPWIPAPEAGSQHQQVASSTNPGHGCARIVARRRFRHDLAQQTLIGFRTIHCSTRPREEGTDSAWPRPRPGPVIVDQISITPSACCTLEADFLGTEDHPGRRPRSWPVRPMPILLLRVAMITSLQTPAAPHCPQSSGHG